MDSSYIFILGLLLKIFLLVRTDDVKSTSPESFNILGLFPHPGMSHFKFFQPLLKGLADKGHNVTILSYFPETNAPKNYYDVVMKTNAPFINALDLKNFDEPPGVLPGFYMIQKWGFEVCDSTFASPQFKNIIQSGVKYDIIITEQFNNDCMMVATHLLQAPAVALSSCAMMPWHFKRLGSPFLPSFMPINFIGHSDTMTFSERVQHFLYFHILNFIYDFSTQRTTNTILKKHFGANVPLIEELVKNTSLMLVNQHYSLTGVKPYSPRIVELGGLQIQSSKTPQDIDREIQHILDTSNNGVIYISWGSLIRSDTLPEAKREAILKSIGRLKETVLWKWENETLQNKPANVVIRKWMPQKEILCHPNVKAFMTHGGLLSSSEAAYCGVPVVVTPIFADQFLNSAHLKSREMAVILPYVDINEESVYDALQSVLSKRYQENAKIVSNVFRNRPMDPLKLGIWWIEHVARTKGSPLSNSITVEFSWFKYFSMDVITFLSMLLLLMWFTMFKIVKLISKLCSKKIKIH